MGAKGMWLVNAAALAMLIAVNLAVSFADETLWIFLDALVVLAAALFCIRQGMRLGRGGCSIGATIDAARRAGAQVYAQLDNHYLAQGWSPAVGIWGVLASALIPYAAGCAYIIITLISQGTSGMDTPLLASRTLAWILSLPWWPFIMHWHENFVALTPDISAMLLITPFLLPLCTFAGYLQGPKLWQRSEEAMKQGRRRAKARARVGKSLAPKTKEPEI